MTRRRTLLARSAATVGLGVGTVLAGCLGDGAPIDVDTGSTGGGERDEEEEEEKAEDESEGHEEPVETHELGDLEAVDDPDELIVRNAGEDDRELELAVTLETRTENGSDDDGDRDRDHDECDTDLERTLTLPPAGFLEVKIGESAGYSVTVESEGALTQSSVGHSGGSSASRTEVEITEYGVDTRTETVSSS